MSDDTSTPRTALVTGAGKRLGLALARALTADGWAVALHYASSTAEAEDAVAEIARTGGHAIALQADFGDAEATEGLVPRAVAALGPLGLLVNNAAVFERDELGSVEATGFDRQMAINLRAPLLLAQAFAGQLPEGAAGNIVNILDQRVVNPTPHYMSYTASKAALWTLTRTWALALAPAIRVNAIGPGIALPDKDHSDADMARWVEGFPLRRGTTPDEMCRALRFILDAPALTGQMITLDGGQHLGWLHPPSGYPLPR